ncbi:MAG TPA: hypothetical protein VNZ86_12665 [Bacteroidia bacterium]|jgi:protein CpxP|nr:hypothetical protein [Bacteroidia bacterium]
MKKILCLLSISASLLAFAPATRASCYFQQDQPVQEKKQKTPEQRATGVSNRLTKDLSLTDDQKKKVYDAALTRAQKMDQARSQPGADRTQMRAQVKSANDAFESSLKIILTPDQFTKWKADNDSRKQNNQPGQ